MLTFFCYWEIGLKAKQGKLELPLSVHAYVARLNRLARLELKPVTVEMWLEKLALEWVRCDLADGRFHPMWARKFG